MSAVLDSNKLDRVAKSKHAAVALEQGMKAGFKAYIAAPGHDREYDAYTSKAGFARYCGEFAPYLEVMGLTAAPAAVVADTSDDTIQAMIEAAVASALAAAGVQVAQPKAKRTSLKARISKPKASKVEVAKGVGRESKFTSKVVASLGLPTKAGSTFVWSGKRSKSTWKVLSGSKTTGIVATRIA